MVQKSSIKEGIEVLAIFSMFALSVFTYLIWWLAFQQGGQLTVNVNFIGEMWAEYLLWVVLTPLITLGMYYYLKQENRTRNADVPRRARTAQLSLDGEPTDND